MGRTAMLKEVTARATVDRDVGGSDRGMSLATKASFGFMAQNEDDADQRHRDMRWATITKMIDVRIGRHRDWELVLLQLGVLRRMMTRIL